MKRVIVLALAGALLVSACFFFAPAVSGRDVGECYANLDTCRERAFNANVGWVRMTLMLTLCDASFGRCVWFA
jgi:hypothetical protein